MRHLYKSFILLTTLFLVACGSSNDEHLDLNEETKSESNSHQEYAKKVFNSINPGINFSLSFNHRF
jgi:thioredoxin-related protein